MTIQKKILVVEDDQDFRDNLSDFLNSLGYVVVAIETIAEFQAIIKDSQFDIGFIDVNLPDGSGHQIARFIRNTSLTRIVMLTARGAESDRLESYAAGADMHLLKPASVNELRAVINMLINRLSESQTTQGYDKEKDYRIEIDGWALNPTPPQLVSPEGKSIDLSVKDYLLIQQIMSANQKLITADYILSKTKFTERLTTIAQLIDRISEINKKIETACGSVSPLKYSQSDGFLFKST